MHHKKIAHYFFAALLLLLLYLSFLIIKPYATYVLLALVLAYSFYPSYDRIKKWVKKDTLAAVLTVVFVIIIIIIPLALITTEIINQAGDAYSFFDNNYFEGISASLSEKFNSDINIDRSIKELFATGINFFIRNAPSFVGSVAEVVLGFFVMFVGMFYLFKKGNRVNDFVTAYVPLKKQYKEDLVTEVKNVTHAVVYSQILVSIVQGTLLGLSFLAFGLPDPIFWGFMGALLSFLPVVGPPMIWIPAGAVKLLSGDVGIGIGVLIFNGLITMNIDNFMRPRIVGEKSRLHPFVTLLGIIGGLKLFGFIGILLGPMILALFAVLLKYFNREF